MVVQSSWWREIQQCSLSTADPMEVQPCQGYLVGRAIWALYWSFQSYLLQSDWQRALTFEELEETVLDIEVNMNDRPLSYMEDDVSFPTLTPSAFLLQSPNAVPELPVHLQDADLRKRSKSGSDKYFWQNLSLGKWHVKITCPAEWATVFVPYQSTIVTY